MMKRYFTLDQANRMLPRVKESAARLFRIQAAVQLLSSIQITYEDSFEEMLQQTKQAAEFHRLQHQLFEEIQKLMRLGCIPKDIGAGLYDFYALKDGEEVLLCWKAGEEQIEHWHDLESGYTGRRPVSELLE